jgi:hypothetical protein
VGEYSSRMQASLSDVQQPASSGSGRSSGQDAQDLATGRAGAWPSTVAGFLLSQPAPPCDAPRSVDRMLICLALVRCPPGAPLLSDNAHRVTSSLTRLA